MSSASGSSASSTESSGLSSGESEQSSGESGFSSEESGLSSGGSGGSSGDSGQSSGESGESSGESGDSSGESDLSSGESDESSGESEESSGESEESSAESEESSESEESTGETESESESGESESEESESESEQTESESETETESESESQTSDTPYVLYVRKIWSDLILGVVANYLPPSSGSGGGLYNYIMVGASTNNTAKLGAQVELVPYDASVASQILVSLAYRNASGAIVTVGTPAPVDASMVAHFSTASYPLAANDNYYVLAWIDNNGDGKYTPGEVRNDSYGWGFCKLVSDETYAASKNKLLNVINVWAAAGFTNAANFMEAFYNDSAISGATPSSTTVTNTTGRLTHNTGAMWNAAGIANIRLNTFVATSSLSDLVRASSEFQNAINQALTAAKPTVQSYVWQPGESTHIFQLNGPTSINFSSNLSDLHWAIGQAELRNFILLATVRRSDLGLVRLDISGKVNDLYDFDNNDDDIYHAVPAAAKVQAGFTSSLPAKISGHIFEVDVVFDKTNFPYQFNFQ